MKASVDCVARACLVPALALLLGGCAVATPSVKESFKSNFRYEPVRPRGTIEANVRLETSHTLSEGVVAAFKRYGNTQATVDAWREAIAEAARDDMLRSGFVKPLPARATPDLTLKVETSESDNPEPNLTVVVSALDPATGSITGRYERRAGLGTSIFAYTGNMRKGLSTALAEIREELLRDYQAGRLRGPAVASRPRGSAQAQPRPAGATGTNDGRAAPAPIGKVVPGQRSYWGFVIEDASGQGVSLTAVKNDSPAGSAGLQAGDILLSINGGGGAFGAGVPGGENTFPLFTPLKLTLKRDGAPLERTISLYGIVPLQLKPARVEFTIPGVPPASDAPSAIEALDHVNVLDQVILDPASGKVAMIGHYDDRFNTGPIPYLDMLKTALVYPKPKFDLNDNSQQQLATIDQQLKDWPTKEFIPAHSSLEQDRQLMLKVWASACGLLPEELVTLFNYVNFSRKEVTPPAHIRKIQGKILRNLGFTEAAEAYDLVSQARADAPVKALQRLGRNAEAQAILARAGDPTTARGLLTAAVYLAILEEIHVPEGEVVNLRHDLTHDRRTWQDVVVTAQGSLLPIRSSTDSRDLAKTTLNTIMLSARGSRTLFAQLKDQETVLQPVDLDRTSQLTRVLFEADYSLKSLVVMPHLFRHIPGAMSLQEYEIQKGVSSRRTQHWLEPKQVAMTVSPGRRVLAFGLAQMDYRTRPLDETGAEVDSGETGQLYDEWCAALTNHYDEYARVMPAFHKVREAAKIIALANWLIAEKVRVDLSGVHQEKWDASVTVPGFWRAGLSYVAKGNDEYSEWVQVGYAGGVTFKRQNWTQVTPAPPATETGASRQLALSAGLGQQAVQAAQSGDLEAARHLAELSAQAMTGRLSPSELAKMNIAVPNAKPAPVSPAGVQLQQAMLQRTNQQIVALRQNPASARAAADALKELNRLYDEVRDKPAAASDYLVKLQTRQVSPPAASRPAVVEPAAEPVCGERAPGDSTLAADRKADELPQGLVDVPQPVPGVGVGKMRTADGTTYEGGFAAGLRSGKGVMRWPNGRIYDGDWANNIFNGTGRMKMPDGRTYEGEYVNGAFHGRGVMRFPNGTVHDGEWADGAPSGKGVVKEASGRVYEGDFLKGDRTGKAVLRFPNGTRYDGDFLKGQFHGTGTLYHPDGKIFMQGKWESDKFSKGWVAGVE